MQNIDLNADLGEGEAYDAELLAIVTRCNIACGGHAGSAESMRVTIVAALAANVSIGAHPSYPDRDGFGRRSKFLSGPQLGESLHSQVTKLDVIARKLGASLTHLKPHGALYTDAADDAALANVIVEVASSFDDIAIVGLPDSQMQKAAERSGLSFLKEAFVDRSYGDDGRLTSRTEQGAVHSNVAKMVEQAMQIAGKNRVTTRSGKSIAVFADTLCLHGDTRGAVDAALAIRAALQREGMTLHASDS